MSISITELDWIGMGRRFIGLKEDVRSNKHNAVLLEWLKTMGTFSKESRAWWADDETPWCGLFVGYCLGCSGRYVVKNWFRALDWSTCPEMTRLVRPAYGSVVVFNRAGGGHVGFVVGQDKKGRIMVLGGNQSNQVSIAPFETDRVVGYYWPARYDVKAVASVPVDARYELPVITSDEKSSINEA